MRLRDLYSTITEGDDHDSSTDTNIPLGVRYTLPKTVIFPDMDLYYEYYKFVTAMACHPEINDEVFSEQPLRDVPFAVAYTPQEYDMIQAVAKRMGKKTQEVAFNGSKEPPKGNTVSPIMKFNMFESAETRIQALYDLAESKLIALMQLTESNTPGLPDGIRSTISPTMTIPSLINSDTYRQYRYTLALAAARAVAAGDVDFNAESTWNESMTAVAYTEEELQTIELANKLMNVQGVMISDTPSQETTDTQTTSPVMKFNMFESTQNMRDIIKRLDN